MSAVPSIPVVKPTDTERAIWQRIRPRKAGGLIRVGSDEHPRDLFPCCYGPRAVTVPDHWNCKMKGGPRAEWWAYMMEDAHRILDVGCGFGFPSFYLASCGHEVVGVDPSPSEIAQAERYRQVEGADLLLKYVVIHQTRLPFQDNTFDGATLSTSLECVGDPEDLVSEVIRVLKPESPVALDEEDRAAQPKTHPVWEKRRLAVIDRTSYLWVETRVCDPYLDRRYMIRLHPDGKLSRSLRQQAPPHPFLWAVELEEAGVSLDEALREANDGEYGEARGYDAYSLRDTLESLGFTDLCFWAHNDGSVFAQELERLGVLAAMPEDIRAVSRAMVRSLRPLSTPTTLVSCLSP